MFSKMDKMWVAGLVTFLAQQAQIFFNITVDPQIQAVAVTVLVAFIVWLTPNKEPTA